MLIVGSAGHCVGGLTADVDPVGTAAPPSPESQVTDEFGCTETGPAGSVPVTVSSSEVQVMPTAVARAALAPDVEVPGPRSRGSSDTVSPTLSTLPSSAWRRVAEVTDRVASVEPRSVTDRAPYTVTGATSTVVSSRRPALDSVTSSSSAVPDGVPGGAIPATAAVTREPIRDTASHSRIPRAASTSGCRRTTPRRASNAEVLSRAVNDRLVPRAGGSDIRSDIRQPPGLRRPSRVDRRWGCCERRVARRAARRCLDVSSQLSGCAAAQRWLRTANGTCRT